MKYPNFEQKPPIRRAHHIFLESRQLKVTKIHIIFCPPRGSKKGISLWTYTSVQRCLYRLFQNQSLHFLLFSLFLKLYQPLGQDQQNIKQIHCQLPIIIFLWTPKAFTSPESFLNFLLNLYIPPWLRKSFKFIMLRLLQMHLWVKKFNLFCFTHAPKKNPPPGFYHYCPGRRKFPIPPEQHFLKIFFPEQKEGERIM